jgi:hypothetical protein
MANTEKNAVDYLDQRLAPNQAAPLWPFGASPALAREVGEHVLRLLDSDAMQALRLTSRAAREFSDGCLQHV